MLPSPSGVEGGAAIEHRWTERETPVLRLKIGGVPTRALVTGLPLHLSLARVLVLVIDHDLTRCSITQELPREWQ